MEKLGSAFGGDVYELGIGEIIELTQQDSDERSLLLSNEGFGHLCKLANIPASFQNKLPDAVSQNVFASQRSVITELGDKFYGLMNDERINVLAPALNWGWNDPAEVMEFNPANGWEVSNVSHQTGMVRYFKSVDPSDKKSFQPCVFVDIPIFYYGRAQMESGLWRVVCTNGLINRVTDNVFNMNLKKVAPTVVKGVMSAVPDVLEGLAGDYKALKQFMHEEVYSGVDMARDDCDDLQRAGMSKTILGKARQHLDIIEGGKDLDVSVEVVPDKVDCMEDAVNIITYMSHRINGSISATKNAEALVFNHYNQKFIESGGSMLETPVSIVANKVMALTS